MADDTHADATDDAAQLRPMVEGLVQAIQHIAQRLDQIEGGHNALQKLVVDDLIGGIESMYKTNVRNGRIEGLKAKYGADLQPHFDVLSKLSPEGTDHWGALHDMTEGMDDGALDGHIKGLAAGLKAKLDEIRGSGAPAPAAVEETKVEAAPEPEAPKAPEEPEPPKKSKDELIAEKMKDSKGFKLR